MPTVTAIPVAATTTTARTSQTINYNGRAASVSLQLVAPNWATDDTAIQVTVKVQQSFDSGTTWTDMCTGMFAPRTFGFRSPGVPPALTCQAGDDRGVRLVRAYLAVSSGSLQLGLDATT